MKFLTSFAVFSMFAAAAMANEASRARPGSIAGAFVTKQSVMATHAPTQPTMAITVPEMHPAPTPKPPYEKPEPGPEPIPPIVNPDDVIVPQLGVSLRVARAACRSITADGYMGMLDETTFQCNIPVVAHNWGGVIRNGGETVMAYVPMGEMFRCNANTFEQVAHLRRSSQWVVPTMIVGGAGIGMGIGAISDANERKRQEEMQRQIDAEKARLQAQIGGTAGNLGSTLQTHVNAPVTVVFDSVTYQLRKRNAADTSCPECGTGPGRDELLVKLKLDPVNRDFSTYVNNIEQCLKLNFQEMISTYTCTGNKRGRIKITRSRDGCLENGVTAVDRIFCGYEAVHATPPNVGGISDCHVKDDNGRIIDADGNQPFSRIFGGQGRCYARDEITNLRHDNQRYQRHNPATQFAMDYDTTAAFDSHRWWVIQDFGTNICAQNSISELGNVCKWVQDVMDNFESDTVAGKGANNRDNEMNNFFVRTKQGSNKTFGNMVSGDMPCGSCEKLVLAEQTVERLREQHGALVALQQAAPTGTMPDLEALLSTIAAKIDIVSEVQLFAQDISSAVAGSFDNIGGERKKFFQRGVGKGLLIGGGVGSLAGLGYWFAEGASVSCNVGGFESTKLNRTYSIPSFRDYIVRGGFHLMK
ncbi:MAG: hypothetical protein FWE52_01555 [Alphaproteobacteria bacterium]|nr:hypothetical protein [Alphaproteobacteria bacterium]